MKMRTIAPVLAALVLATTATAQQKIGFVDIDKVTLKARSVTSLMTGMRGELEKMQKEMDSKRQKIADLNADITRNEGVVAKDEQDRKKKEVNRLKNEIDEMDYKLRQQMRDVEQSVLEPLKKQIVTAIEDVAREQNYDIVLTREAVIFHKPAADMTDEVVRRLNADQKPAAAPAARTAEPRTEPAAATKTETPAPAETAATPAPEPEATPTPTPRPRRTESTPKPSGNTTTRKRAVDRQPD